MQLGELQSQLPRFEERGVRVAALSVDEPAASTAMIERLGIEFPLVSDPEQEVVKAFRVQNPKTQELALHAVYILDEQGKVIYRKVARRRPSSNELLDAIDAHRGEYPRADKPRKKPERTPVAYPRNIFQAALTLGRVDEAPSILQGHEPATAKIVKLMKKRAFDDGLVAWRALAEELAAAGAKREALLDAAAWLTRQATVDTEVIADAKRLDELLQHERQLSDARNSLLISGTGMNADMMDDLEVQLRDARASLQIVRTRVRKHRSLRFAKVMLRSFREVAKGAARSR